MIYSFALYERQRDANVLRVESDDFDRPLNINQGTRLQLGSTAKLRTLITYLQIAEELHQRYAGLSPLQLQAVHVLPGDNLTRWAVDYLARTSDRTVLPMLEAALDRKYSANPGEAFFTAGGLHSFGNFDRSEDSEVLTVREGFENSVNLVFIRLMRDIEGYYLYRVPGSLTCPACGSEQPGAAPVPRTLCGRGGQPVPLALLRPAPGPKSRPSSGFGGPECPSDALATGRNFSLDKATGKFRVLLDLLKDTCATRHAARPGSIKAL